MGTPGNSSRTGLMKGVALVTELGFGIAIPMVVGALAGSYLDERFGGRGLIFVLVFLVGLASGLFNGYWLLRKVVEQNK